MIRIKWQINSGLVFDWLVYFEFKSKNLVTFSLRYLMCDDHKLTIATINHNKVDVVSNLMKKKFYTIKETFNKFSDKPYFAVVFFQLSFRQAFSDCDIKSIYWVTHWGLPCNGLNAQIEKNKPITYRSQIALDYAVPTASFGIEILKLIEQLTA